MGGTIVNRKEAKIMTYVICEPCVDVKDTACVDVCPVDCIHPTSEFPELFEAANQLFIDPEECIDCGVCEPECPVEAIFAEDDVPDEWEHYTQINAAFLCLKPDLIFPEWLIRVG